MPTAVLDVEPQAYDAASRVLGTDIAVPLVQVVTRLSGTLDGCGGMAGSDDAGREWAGAYDDTAAATLAALGDAVNAGYRLAAVLAQSGLNHGMADDASVPGGLRPTVDDNTYLHYRFDPLPAPPPSVGMQETVPTGWGRIEHLVRLVWPGGHQDRLRRAAAAWTAAADALDVAAWGVPAALSAIGGQRSPEVPRVVDALESMQLHYRDLASACSSLASACERYAQLLDECRSRAEHEMASPACQTVLIEGVGWGLSWLTAGTSAAAAQAAEMWRVQAVATRVAEIITECAAAVRAVVGACLEVAAAVPVRVQAALAEVLSKRIVVMATPEGVPALTVVRMARADRGIRQAQGATKSTGSVTLAERLRTAPIWSGRRLPERDGPANGLLIKVAPSGEVTNYAIYDADGLVVKRVDLTGRGHGPFPTPHVQEYVRNIDPRGNTWPGKGMVRPATREELP